LRKAGATYRQIAKQLLPHPDGRHITPQAVCKMIRRVLDRLAVLTEQDAEEVRRLEIQRLDAMLLGLWPKARAGHEGAVDRVLKISQRRAELLGLDAPKRQEMSGPGGNPLPCLVVKFADEPTNDNRGGAS